MQLNREVFPAPFGPTRPKITPGSTSKLTSCSTLTPPKCRLTSLRLRLAATLYLPVASSLGMGAVDHHCTKPTVRIADEIVNDFGIVWRSGLRARLSHPQRTGSPALLGPVVPRCPGPAGAGLRRRSHRC